MKEKKMKDIWVISSCVGRALFSLGASLSPSHSPLYFYTIGLERLLLGGAAALPCVSDVILFEISYTFSYSSVNNLSHVWISVRQKVLPVGGFRHQPT